MQNTVQIEQMTLAEKPALLAFLREAYAENPRMSDQSFWDWHFLENPYVEPDNLPVWLAKCEGRIAGQLAATPVDLKIGGERKRAIWILDLIVHDDFRRRGIARRLALKSEEYCPVGLGINTTEQHSTAVLESIGWRVPCRIPRYSKILHAGNALSEISRISPLRRVFNFLSAPARPRLDALMFAKNGNLRLLKTFDARFDDLWNDAGANWNCAVVRDARFLEWQYLRQPAKKFEIIGYFENERLRGYAIIFVRKAEAGGAVAKASIADLCYGNGDAQTIVDALLRGALQIAASRGAGRLVTDVLDSLIEERLARFGFRSVKNPLQFLVKSNQNQDMLCDAQNWFLTRGDSDISIFEHPNL
jgi:GNAT superfamily N-acetyltransferase